MLIAPPVFQILDAKHPRLAIGAIADGSADLRVAISTRSIEPVIALAARHIGFQIIDVIDRRVARRCIKMRGTIAPVAQGHVVVDADDIDTA